MATKEPFDLFNLPHPVIALVNIEGRMTIAPDTLFYVVIDPAKLSPSREFLHFDQRRQQTDVNGWFPVDSIKVVEVLGECTAAGVPTPVNEKGQAKDPGAIYYKRVAASADVKAA